MGSSCGGRPRSSGAVGDETAWHVALSFQELTEKARRRPPVSARLHEDVDDVPVLVDSTPQVLPLPLNRDEQLIQIPLVTEAPLTAPKPTRIVESKGLTPVPNRFVRDRDAPLREQVFHIAETETETMVEPHRVADDQRWEAVPVVADGFSVHPPTVPVAASN